MRRNRKKERKERKKGERKEGGKRKKKGDEKNEKEAARLDLDLVTVEHRQRPRKVNQGKKFTTDEE